MSVSDKHGLFYNSILLGYWVQLEVTEHIMSNEENYELRLGSENPVLPFPSILHNSAPWRQHGHHWNLRLTYVELGLFLG